MNLNRGEEPEASKGMDSYVKQFYWSVEQVKDQAADFLAGPPISRVEYYDATVALSREIDQLKLAEENYLATITNLSSIAASLGERAGASVEALKRIRRHHVRLNARACRPISESKTIALCDSVLKEDP